MPRRPPSKTKPLYGLRAKAMPRSVAWKAEVDYAHKLNDEEKEFLSKFNEEVVGASFNHPDPLIPNDGKDGTRIRREIYRAKNSANADAMEPARATGRLLFPDSAPTNSEDGRARRGSWESISAVAPSSDPDIAPTPSYLSDPRYKQALAAFRALLHDGSRTPATDNTTALNRARSKLERIRREYEAETSYDSEE